MPSNMTTHALTRDDVRTLHSATVRAQDYLLLMTNQVVDNLHGGFGIDDQPDERTPEERRPLQASAAITMFTLATVRELRCHIEGMLDEGEDVSAIAGLLLEAHAGTYQLHAAPGPAGTGHTLLGTLFNVCLAAGYDREEMKLLERLMDL